MIGVYIVIAFCVVIVAIFVTLMFTKGKDVDAKKPKVISLDNLQEGRYIKRKPNGLERGCVDILIRPDNSFFWKTSWIKGIPEEAIKYVDSPDSGEEDGVSNSGYYIITHGKDGKQRILEEIGIAIGDKSQALREKIKRLKFENRKAKDEIRRKSEDIEAQVDSISNINKKMNRERERGLFPKKR